MVAIAVFALEDTPLSRMNEMSPIGTLAGLKIAARLSGEQRF